MVVVTVPTLLAWLRGDRREARKNRREGETGRRDRVTERGRKRERESADPC